MVHNLEYLDSLLEEINDEELKLLIIEVLFELVKELPEEIIEKLKAQLKEYDENSTDQNQCSFPEVPSELF